MAEKSKIMVIGATGNIGKFMVEASAKTGHPTLALVRESSLSDPFKAKLVENYKKLGVCLIYGDLDDHEKLVKAIKQVDVVISTIGRSDVAIQFKLIAAIKEAGNVKRLIPSEFGSNVDAGHPIEPATSGYARKSKIRRAIEAEGIPFTYISCNCTFGFFLPTLAQPGSTAPPRDKILIYGDAQPKAYFNSEADIATFTIKAVDDPRTMNRTLYLRPPKNTFTFNELVAMWEKKLGKTLEKIFVTKEQIIKMIEDANMTDKIMLLVNYSIFMLGEQSNFEIEPSSGVEACELYSDVNYATVEDYLDQLACSSN